MQLIAAFEAREGSISRVARLREKAGCGVLRGAERSRVCALASAAGEMELCGRPREESDWRLSSSVAVEAPRGSLELAATAGRRARPVNQVLVAASESVLLEGVGQHAASAEPR